MEKGNQCAYVVYTHMHFCVGMSLSILLDLGTYVCGWVET